MKTRLILTTLVFLSWTVLTLDAASAKPNVLILLADDLGYGELGCQGNPEIPTPHIDSLARHGIRFTQGYVSGPYCSPTRAGLMTGRYQTRFGHEFNGSGPAFGLPLKEKTIAQRMKDLGYATCAVGKWHLGGEMQFRPTRRGFDEFYGTLANTPYFQPRSFVDSRNSDEVQAITDETFYTTEKYADRAVDWLERAKGKPWFLYLPFNAQHAPLQAPEKYLSRFQNITNQDRRTFAAMLSAMDDAVGRVLGKIRQMGEEENTLIFFVSDNGGPTKTTTSSNGTLRGFKATTWEGGVRVPFIVQWKSKLPEGKTYTEPVIQLDILPTVLRVAGGKADPAGQLDGVDLMPYLRGEKQGRPHERFYWRFGNQWAVRSGDWKLVVGNGGGPEAGLFDLAKDPNESADLAALRPEVVKELRGHWEKWNAEQIPPAWGRADGGNRRRPAGAGQRPRAGARSKRAAGAASAAAALPVSFAVHRLGRFRSEAVSVADFTGDGKPDVMAGAYLYAAPEWTAAKVRTLAGSVDEAGKGYYDDFTNLPLDVDGDGKLDVVTCGWFSQSVKWHRNVGSESGEWPLMQESKAGNYECAHLHDIDGDGKANEVLAHSVATEWFEAGVLAEGGRGLIRHVVSARALNFGGGVGDLNGDGRPDILRPDAWYEGPADPRQGSWVEHDWGGIGLGGKEGKAQHTPDIYVHDVDGDGWQDVITSSAHEYGIFWYRQERAEGKLSWRQHIIDESWTQAHSLALADLDGDAAPELITGKRFMAHNGSDPDESGPLGVYFYKLSGGPKPVWSKQKISFDEGIGSGVNLAATDLDGDGDVDVVVTGKWGGPVWFENKRR